jgi:Zn finger protein HypA/HybF involved in hydrogenase expression
MKFRTNPLIPTNILLSFKILLKGVIMNIKFNFNPAELEKKIRKEATNQLKKKTFNVSCPKCSTNVSAIVGKNTCPNCGSEIDFKLNGNL